MASSTANSINELNQSLTGVSNPLSVNDNLLTGSLSPSISATSSLPVIEDSSNSNLQNIGASSSNPTTVIKSNPFAIVGNVIVDNGKWITDAENTPEGVSSAVSTTVKGLLDSVIVKLRNKLPLSDAGNTSSSGNPFADGKNPFGDGNQPSLPGLDDSKSYGENAVADGSNPFASGENAVAGGSNPFASGENAVAGGSNPFASGENAVAGGSNPFASGENPFAGGGMSQPSSFDISKLVLGDNLPNGTQSTTELLTSVKDNITNFTSSLGDLFVGGNTTPLQTPSDLLRLFRADMFSFNNGVNSVNELASTDTSSAGSSNPFLSLFAGGGEVPSDINNLLNVALEGLLPFSGSDNVFSTPDGELPIGYGNHDFGKNNATIGNANWDYGNANATIGNGNWLWDSSTKNVTIGNGNWNLDFSHDNKTIGNGNWYWNSTSDNTTLGNGNWSFGNNNTTLGNGNFDFGSNNTVIGNGNQVFTSNSIVIGNGNWSVVIDKSAPGASDFLSQLNTWQSGMGVKDATDNLVDSLMGKLGEVFQPLTGDLSASGSDTYNRLFFC